MADLSSLPHPVRCKDACDVHTTHADVCQQAAATTFAVVAAYLAALFKFLVDGFI